MVLRSRPGASNKKRELSLTGSVRTVFVGNVVHPIQRIACSHGKKFYLRCEGICSSLAEEDNIGLLDDAIYLLVDDGVYDHGCLFPFAEHIGVGQLLQEE